VKTENDGDGICGRELIPQTGFSISYVMQFRHIVLAEKGESLKTRRNTRKNGCEGAQLGRATSRFRKCCEKASSERAQDQWICTPRQWCA
jgi:hypothetical protein